MERVDGLKRICTVFLPHGSAHGPSGLLIDCDDVYERLIGPAVLSAGFQPCRVDPANLHEWICITASDWVIVDMNFVSADLMYEVGIRHAVRPGSTIVLSSSYERTPFGLDSGLVVRYQVGSDGKVACGLDNHTLVPLLKETHSVQGTLFQMLDGIFYPGMIDHLKTDVFRDRVPYSPHWRERLRLARKTGPEAVRAVESEIGDVNALEPAVVVDLLLSWRAVEGWPEMIALVERSPAALTETAMIQEQYAFALNRTGRREAAEDVLLGLISRRGPMPETCALLGRVYKDAWSEAQAKGDVAHAGVLLDKAIAAYLDGFDSDRRDAYPGINALTLMELRNLPDERRHGLLSAVETAVQKKIAPDSADYWDLATLMELAVLAGDRKRATSWAERAIRIVREPWEPKTTARNVRLIREAREQRNEETGWMREIEEQLLAAASGNQ